jgi:hypothetical protein
MKARINPRRFLTIDGVPVARVLPTGELEFKDKDLHRSARRRSTFVTVTVEEIKAAVDTFTETTQPPTENE